jgi:N-acetylglutamate synthase-like GNAT family acetyltransferase
MPIITATIEDIPKLVALINSAYRGEESKKGWTTEADIIKGTLRIDEPALTELINVHGGRFLKFVNEQNRIGGCVYLHKNGEDMYLGMLSVSPTLQANGIGKQLMNEAEIHSKKLNCDRIFMRVISLRHELIQWYEKQGYHQTEKREPFPKDTRFGTPLRPLEFLIMEKKIK